MLALVQAPQDTLVTAAADLEWWEVGPTDARGWTALWCTERHDLTDAQVDALLGGRDSVTFAEGWRTGAEDHDDGLLVQLLHVVAQVAGRSTSCTISSYDAGPALTDVAEVLVAAFGAVPPGDAAAVASALTQHHDDLDDLARALMVLLDLPAVVPPEECASVLVHSRGSRASVRAVEIGARLEGPVEVTTLDDGWRALRPEVVGPTAYGATTAGLGSVGDHLVVLLERGPGTARVEVHHDGGRLGATTWDGWAYSAERPDWGAALASALGPGTSVAEADAVLRGRGGGDPLRRFTELVGIPARALVLLDGPGAASYDEVRGTTSEVRMLAAMLAPGRWRWRR